MVAIVFKTNTYQQPVEINIDFKDLLIREKKK